jgi:SAM-dependent methyltransferase
MVAARRAYRVPVARYTYGDSDLARERLGLVARLFESTSRAFLASAGGAPRVALDLGCGPGHTTALVQNVTGAPRVLGMDRSSAFLGGAAVGDGRRFVAADVSLVLPVRAADLIYARLLLAHLVDPAAVAAHWSTILTNGGRLLVDDLEAIETRDDIFRTYLDEVALHVVRREGGSLFVGPILRDADDPAGCRRIADAVASFAPVAADTARVFAMNLAVLTERGEIGARPALADALAAIGRGERHAEPVRWQVRQLAWERSG